MEEQRFSDLGRVEAIRLLIENSPFKGSEGHSFESKKGGEINTAHKIFTEGINFDLTYFPLQHLGYKCVIGITGELYASMSKPMTLSIQLGISSKLDFKQIKEIWGGMCTAAKEHGYENVELDLCPSPNGLTISLSATGITSLLTAKRRPKASSKDLICVSGSLGAAYLGMSILEKGKPIYLENHGKDTSKEAANHQEMMKRYKMLVGSYLKPELNASTVSHLEDSEIIPSRGYFISKGLADGIKRLTRDTDLGAKVYVDKIPFEGNTFAAGKELDIDPISAAMNGGDDYRLLFVVPILSLEKFRRDFQTFDIIGHLAKKEVGSVLVTPEGVELSISAPDWKDIETEI